MQSFKHLFEPVTLRHKTLRNRVVFGAHTTNMSEQGLPGEQHLAYYRERAMGGVAMIVIEPVPVHAAAVLTRGNFRHADDSVIPHFRKITDACHDEGAVVLQQLYHVGQHGDSDNSYHAHWSPSGLPSYHDSDGSHAMTVDTGGEWKWIRQDMRKDLDWSNGHSVHVEYAAVAGEVAVAKTVASLEEPTTPEPATLAAANAALAAADLDWSAGRPAELLRTLREHAAARAAVLSEARLVSAVAPAVLDGNGFDWHVLLKGSAARPGELAPRRFLEAIDGVEQPAWPDDSSGRMLLAERVLDPANPLTARVIVNRVWHHLFGRGLVPTTDNFGVLGEAAADPLAQQLLDTLAVRFRDEGWSLKQLIRSIVTSSTWRMSTSRVPLAHEQDPLNLLLHHYPLRRLEGEAIRDSMLAVSGRLDRTVGGPSVEVFIAPYHEGRGRPASGPLDGGGRRSLYTMVRRNFLPSLLVAFDMPVPFQARGRRNVTNVPAQALALMNDPFVAEQSRLWAQKILADASLSTDRRLDQMYREAFARLPDAQERTAATAFLEAQTALHGGSFADDPRQEAAWTDLAHALFNAKEFIFLP